MVRIATTLAGIAPNELRSLRDMFRTRGQRIKVGNENAKWQHSFVLTEKKRVKSERGEWQMESHKLQLLD